MRRVSILAAAIVIGASGSASAATIPVTSNTDDGTGCTLREAIAAAGANTDTGGCTGTAYGDDTITFAPSVTGTIPLTSQLTIDPSAPGTLDIEGPGADSLAVSGQDANRVLSVASSANSIANAVTISGLEIRDGFIGALDENVSAVGAGISTAGVLNLDRVVVTENALTVNVAGGGDPAFAVLQGGGIFNLGTLLVRRSTISANALSGTATSDSIAFVLADGGGIFSAGALTVRQSTISANTVTASGTGGFQQGGAAQGGGISLVDQIGPTNGTVEGSTIVGNLLAGSSGSRGGGVSTRASGNPVSLTVRGSTLTNNNAAIGSNVLRDAGTLSLRSTVLAEPAGGGGNCQNTGGASFTSAGHNLSDDSSCNVAGTGDISNTPANLQPLADYGGPTLTRRPAAPTVGTPSPLIDAGVAAGQTEDQRGLGRTVDYDLPNNTGGDGTDIGAVEIQGATPTGTSPGSPSTDTAPEVTGITEPGTTVQLYRDATCTTAVGSPGSPEAFASPGLTATLAANSSTSFRARAAYGTATSLCSPTGVTYVVPPTAPTLATTIPVSPANDNNPRIKGTADPGTTVTLYTAPGCTGAAAGTGSDADLVGTGIQVSVPDNSATTFYAQGTGAGGTSGCSAGIAYTESTPAPTGQPPILTPAPTPAPALTKCKKKKKSKPKAAAAAAKKCKRKGKKK